MEHGQTFGRQPDLSRFNGGYVGKNNEPTVKSLDVRPEDALLIFEELGLITVGPDTV